MAWTAAQIPDQSGKVAVVTGANAGLGLQIAHALAARGAHVVMTARDVKKGERAAAELRASTPAARVEVLPIDLAALASVRELASAVAVRHERVDILVNNAGVMATPSLQTTDGFELQLGTNHLGHFALTALLLPRLFAAAAARVVAVTSVARFFGGRVDPDDPHLRDGYDPWRAYGRSKMANLDFALALDAKLRAAGTPAISVAAHPGLSSTGLQARSVDASGGGASQRFFHAAARLFGMPPQRGALAQLRAATDPEVVGGALYGPLWGTFGAPVRKPILARSSDDLATLWALSERETGVSFEVSLP